MLEIKNVHKVFFKGLPDEKAALNGLDLKLENGDFAIVIGTNGAGKSSMLNAVSGSFPIDSGEIRVGGVDVTRQPVHQRASRLARVFQDPMRGTAAGMTIAENMLLADLRGKPRSLRKGLTAQRLRLYAERLEVLGLGLENRIQARVELLSGGQRQSLSLIMAVSNSPDILLLDEHTAALDPRTAELVMKATIKVVRAFKLTTLMVTHNMQHAVDFGNRVVMMDAGKVRMEINGAAKENITVPELVQLFSVKSDAMLLSA